MRKRLTRTQHIEPSLNLGRGAIAITRAYETGVAHPCEALYRKYHKNVIKDELVFGVVGHRRRRWGAGMRNGNAHAGGLGAAHVRALTSVRIDHVICGTADPDALGPRRSKARGPAAVDGSGDGAQRARRHRAPRAARRSITAANAATCSSRSGRRSG